MCTYLTKHVVPKECKGNIYAILEWLWAVVGGECLIDHNTRHPQDGQKYDQQLYGTSLVGIFRASFPNDYHVVVRKLESLDLYVHIIYLLSQNGYIDSILNGC